MKYRLADILDTVELNGPEAGEIFDCTKGAIYQRRLNGSSITADELYALHKNALENQHHDKVSLLSPYVAKVFPLLYRAEKTLAEFSGSEFGMADVNDESCRENSKKSWCTLHLFIGSTQAAAEVRALIQSDLRVTSNARIIRVYITGTPSTFLSEIVQLFTDEDEMLLRFDLYVHCVSELPFPTSLVLVDNSLLLLPSGDGFVDLAGHNAQLLQEAVSNIIENHPNAAVGPIPVRSVGETRITPSAADGSVKLIDLCGQLGGNYQLELIPGNSGQVEDTDRWLMRLSASEDDSKNRSVKIFDQAGRRVIDALAEHLPWQGFWPYKDWSPLGESEHLLISEAELTEL